MKAWVLHNINDIRLENIANPAVQEDEVLVAVKAAGICGSDIPRVFYMGTYSYPLIPGHEFSGVVKMAGKKAGDKWENQRVGIFPLIPCYSCKPCHNEQYEMCRRYSYLGSRRNGGFAEYVAVPANNLIRLPENVGFEEAAMMEPMSVAVHAMRKAATLESESIAICGLGAIGLFLLMFLTESGKKNILAIGNKEFQKKMAVKIGLPEECYCDSRQQNVDEWLLKKTDGMGVNVFFECVGKNETFRQAVRLTGAAGRIVLVGNPASDMTLEKEVYWKVLRNQLTVMGTWNSSFTHDMTDDWHYVLERLENRRIEPADLITHKFPLEELKSGFKIMRDKKEDYGKVMAIL